MRGKWRKHEDDVLKEAVEKHGIKWNIVASYIPFRTPAQCRERWNFHLDPNLNKAPYTFEEDSKLMKLFEKHGNRWAIIASELDSNRSEIACRTRIYSLLRMQRKEAAVALAISSNSLCETSSSSSSEPSPCHRILETTSTHKGLAKLNVPICSNNSEPSIFVPSLPSSGYNATINNTSNSIPCNGNTNLTPNYESVINFNLLNNSLTGIGSHQSIPLYYYPFSLTPIWNNSNFQQMNNNCNVNTSNINNTMELLSNLK